MQGKFDAPQSSTEDGFLISSEDDFEIVTMYGRPICNPSSNMLPYSLTPNPTYTSQNETADLGYPILSAISATTTRDSCHPLQGVPFKLAPTLELSSNVQQDSVLEDVKQTLERVKNLLISKDFDYDFSLERNYLRDVEPK